MAMVQETRKNKCYRRTKIRKQQILVHFVGLRIDAVIMENKMEVPQKLIEILPHLVLTSEKI